MKNLSSNRRWWLVFATSLTAALLISVGVFSANRQEPKKNQRPQPPQVTSMPAVYSSVNTLEIVRTWIVNQELGVPAARVEIRNNSNKDIVAVDLVCGEGAVTTNGLTDEEHPIVVVKAHDNTVLEMNFSAMTFGAPLVVSAVTYADGSEEGDAKSLRAMHIGRQHDREVMRARREQGKGAKP